MKFLFLGDVVGRTGREAVIERVPELRRRHGLDAVIVNAENAAHGFGITEKIADELFAGGVDVITTGNHAWDQREVIGYFERQANLLRPINYPAGTPGRGATLLQLPDGRKMLVVNAMARLFMDPLDDPFAAVERILQAHPLRASVQAILVDFHGEATSEKMAMGHFCDGRVSLVIGTHSHVPTADQQILPGGTAYQTDAGMCADYDSVIGMRKEPAVDRFVRKLPTDRLTPANGAATICGAVVTTDDATGLATAIEPLRLGGRLAQIEPTPVRPTEREAA